MVRHRDMEGVTPLDPIAYIERSAEVLLALRADAALMARVHHAAALCATTLGNRGRVLFCGNGGSAADAQHFAAELTGRFLRNRPAMAAIALTTDTSALTAIGNDFGFEAVFSRQVEALGQPDDVLVGISTSGMSPNICLALEVARGREMHTIGLTGRDGGDMAHLCDVELRVPSGETPLIQQGHLVLGHLLCGMIEATLHPAA